MANITVNTDSVAAEVRSLRDGCATDNGRDAVDAVAISLGHLLDRQDRDGTFDHAAFLRACGVQH